MLVELIGGLLAGSLAIMTDAAHLLSDCSGFFLSIFALYLSKKKPTQHYTYGYHRAEVIGALGSIVLIWFLTACLLYEAVMRIITPEDVDGMIMLITSIIGLFCNLVMGKVLHSGPGGHHHGHSHGGHSHGGHSHGPEKKGEHQKVDSKNNEDNLNSNDHKEEVHEHHGNDHGHNHENHEHKHEHKNETHDSHSHSHHGHSHEENVNIRAAMIHIIGDII
jgi:zinc transporter 2